MRSRLPRRFLVPAGLTALLLAGVLLFLLHFDAARRFRERMDRFPSRIYAAGLILRPGTSITPEGLEERLQRLGYRRSGRGAPAPGEYRRSWGTFEIRLRPGEDEADPGQVRVRIRGSQVVNLFDSERNWIDEFPIGARPLGTFFGDLQEDRVPVRLEQVPAHLQQAILTMEDRRFHRHPGIDPIGILRAAWANLRAGRVVQGGSTITQQLAKNLYHGRRRSLPRKLFEVIVAVDLERQFTKDEILEAYLNDIYLGQRGPVAISGVGAATEYYFGKPVEALTLADSALIAGLIRSPGSYNPRSSPGPARDRRNLVIDRMEEAEQIPAAEAAAARKAPLGVLKAEPPAGGGSHLTDFVQRSLRGLGLGRPLPRAGLRILTTIDADLQEAAERAVSAGLKRLEASYPSVDPDRTGKRLEAALVALDPADGAVLALVGGREYGRSQFNRADQARRQPGSLFKPFVYLAGFELARLDDGGWFTPATVLEDTPLEVVVRGQPWRPQNYDGNYRGLTTAREALEMSLNVPTVRAAQRIGLERIVDTARRCGIASPLLAVPSLALGTLEVSPLEMAAAFAVLPNGGRRVPVSALLSVSGPAGPIYQGETAPAGEQVVSPEAAWLVTDILRGVVEEGTAVWLRSGGLEAEVAAKTGTSDETRDAWFVGYTPRVLALVWVGYDDGESIGLSGSRAAAPIWLDFFERAGLNRDAERFRPPPGIETAWIDPESGQLATGGCPETVREQFIRGTEPADACLLHGGGPRRNWKWLRRLFSD